MSLPPSSTISSVLARGAATSAAICETGTGDFRLGDYVHRTIGNRYVEYRGTMAGDFLREMIYSLRFLNWAVVANLCSCNYLIVYWLIGHFLKSRENTRKKVWINLWRKVSRGYFCLQCWCTSLWLSEKNYKLIFFLIQLMSNFVFLNSYYVIKTTPAHCAWRDCNHSRKNYTFYRIFAYYGVYTWYMETTFRII